MPRFVEFEAWAGRAHGTQAALGSRAALHETVFSRIRSDDAVVGAWVDVVRRRPEHLALPVGAPSPERAVWQSVRTSAFGEVQVAVQRPCEVRVGGAAAPPDAGCVLIRRAQATAPAERLVVTVAYRASPR